MPGMPFDRLPASGPMAQQAEQDYKSVMNDAEQEYRIEMDTLNNQRLPEDQFNRKAATLHGKHKLQALKMKREWNQRMTQINEYEKLGAAGTMTPGQADTAQYALSGYRTPEQKKPDYWAEHQKLIQERNRLEQHFYDNWGEKGWKKKTRRVLEVNKDGKVTKWGDAPTEAEQAGIDRIKDQIKQLDQYELALVTQMNPQNRKVNQLSRAMGMGPRVQNTPGVGGRRTNLPLGTPESLQEPEKLETPGYKMTKEKAIQQAQAQLGTNNPKDRERIVALARQIYGAK